MSSYLDIINRTLEAQAGMRKQPVVAASRLSGKQRLDYNEYTASKTKVWQSIAERSIDKTIRFFTTPVSTPKPASNVVPLFKGASQRAMEELRLEAMQDSMDNGPEQTASAKVLQFSPGQKYAYEEADAIANILNFGQDDTETPRPF